MDPISANSELHLRELIAHAMAVQGEKADLNHIDVGAISNFEGLFEGSPFNGNISHWHVSQGIYADNMFKNSAFDGDISHWNGQWLQTADGMFSNSVFNGDISQWNTSSVLDAQIMFHSSGFARDISAWNLSPQAKTLFMFAKNPKDRAAQTPTEWVVRAFLTDLIKDGYTCDPSLSLGRAMSEYHRLSAALGFDPNDMPRDVLNLHHALQTREPSYPVDRLLEPN